MIATNCWILPVAHPTNGAAVLFAMRNLTIDRGGGFNAESSGFAGAVRVPDTRYHGFYPAYGPGATTSNWDYGSGHGGLGAGAGGGPIYGNADAPVLPGSGARASGYPAGSDSAWGGGSVQIRARGTVTVKGQITANANHIKFLPMTVYRYGPGSSGGAIYITCHTFIGDSGGVLQASADQINQTLCGYGGGGGRIAVWRVYDQSATPISTYVNGGVGFYGTGAPGTLVMDWIPRPGTLMSLQ